MCMSDWPRDRTGFSLMEAMVALTVVGLAAVSMLATVGAELRTASRIRTSLEAHALAEDKLAAVRLLSRDELDRLGDSLRQGQFPAPFQSYRWEASTRETAESKDLFEVAVGIRWEDGSYDLATRLYRPKPLPGVR